MATVPLAIDIDVAICINGSTVEVTLEGNRSPTNTPIAWNGTSFSGASFGAWTDGESFPGMIISGELNDENTITITIAANGGTTMMDIAYGGDNCDG
jgi:hypothetical protein